MTPQQEKRFKKLCKDMAALLTELREGEHPNACLFVEDGCVDLYDWPPEVERRPYEVLCDGGIWPGASGGGR